MLIFLEEKKMLHQKAFESAMHLTATTITQDILLKAGHEHQGITAQIKALR